MRKLLAILRTSVFTLFPSEPAGSIWSDGLCGWMVKNREKPQAGNTTA
jgi:hypothetical protein